MVPDLETHKKKGQGVRTTDVRESPASAGSTHLPYSQSEKALLVFEKPEAAKQIANNTQTDTNVESGILYTRALLLRNRMKIAVHLRVTPGS